MNDSNPSTIDHDFIIKTVLENGGEIVGGYMRAWVSNGNPSDTGWDDVDVICRDEKNQTRIREELSDAGIFVDFRPTFSFTDFWCNCWKFDGNIKMIEPALSKKSFSWLESQTKEKIAQCIFSFQYSMRLPYRVVKLIKRGWKIADTKGNIADSESILERYC
jgi:hypothetical protein